ncbi:hypothetical protein ED733_000307 [Metarhizium rileyi]|uniref:DUF7907 domain-containing protein n=1 Tax=Metarhizium rileyi (strain RCEF 4871) TaxID=1649241 RepID=A0A5C6G385_METRR|nr:hypothetical protein ED733_000307 [Metarhizium rileyi]
MLVSVATLGLIGLATASPLGDGEAVPNYPPIFGSKAFRLVINVTDRSNDLIPSIQNTYVSSIHVGAGLAILGKSADIKKGRIFYQNGTMIEYQTYLSNVLSDSGTPPFPSGITLVRDLGTKTVSTGHLDGGAGDAGIGITRFPEPYAYLYPETWVACPEAQPYYHEDVFVVLKRMAPYLKEDGNIRTIIPKGCAPVRLIPECTELAELDAGSIINHNHVLFSMCYNDVKSLNWTEYGP